MMGEVYSAVMKGVAVSTAKAVFIIQAPTTNRVRIREVRLGQYSDFGDAASEILSVHMVRAATSFATEGGIEISPQNMQPSARVASSRVVHTANVATDGGVRLVADVMNIAAGHWYYPPSCEQIWVNPGSNLAVVLSAPADALTMNGKL